MATSTTYVGPTLASEGLEQNRTFSGGVIPASLQDLYANSADVNLLTVLITDVVAARAATKTPGTPEYDAYTRLSNGQIRNDPPASGGGGSSSPGVGPIDFTLQDAATEAGNGTAYKPTRGNETLTFEITGSSTSRTIIFEMAGPAGIYVPCTAFNVMDPTVFEQQTTGGNNTLPESWSVTIPAGYSFRARIIEMAEGNVTIKGKAVV